MATTKQDGERRAVAAAISARILAAQAGGLGVRESIDEVLGAGTYAALASTLHDALREAAVDERAFRDLAVLRGYAASRLGRFALAIAAGNTPEAAATMARRGTR